MLYAVHELFKRAAKSPDLDFDHLAWRDAVHALVPWAFRKQSMEDRRKIKNVVSFPLRGGLYRG